VSVVTGLNWLRARFVSRSVWSGNEYPDSLKKLDEIWCIGW
jgi:hypothetical protein